MARRARFTTRVFSDYGGEMSESERVVSTSEHILPLSIQYTSPRLQILASQPLCQRQRPRIRCPRCYRNLLPLLPLHLGLSLWLSSLNLGLLLRHLLLTLVVLESLLLELIDVLIEGQTSFVGFRLDLLPLLGLQLLGGHASSLGFGGNLLLDNC